MSTYEYNDLFFKAQVSGQYNMFIFDMVDSKKMENATRKLAHNKMIELMLRMYDYIRELENSTRKKILLVDKEIVSYNNSLDVMYKFGMLMEPFLFGDAFGFTIYRNSLSKDEIIEIYHQCRKELEINFCFHVIDGYYETNKWEEGSELFFRGYCIDILSNYHKTLNNDLRKTKCR